MAIPEGAERQAGKQETQGPGKWLPLTAAVLGMAMLTFGGLLGYRVVTAPAPLPDIPATDHTGKPAKLSDFRGRWVLVYFGYTHCPDICPQGLSTLSKAVRGLGPDAGRLQSLLVSVDPARDTTAVLADYVTFYRFGLVGWHMARGDLAAFAKAFGATYGYGEGAASGSMEHPAVFYVVDPRGMLSKEPIFPPVTTAELQERMKGGR